MDKLIASQHFTLSDSKISFSIFDTDFGPALSITTGSFGNLFNTNKIYITEKTILELADLFKNASEYDKYSKPYVHAIKTIEHNEKDKEE